MKFLPVVLPLLCALSLSAADDVPATVEKLILDARSAMRGGDEKKALALAAEAVKLAPNKIEPHLFRGQLHGILGKHEQSVADFSAALKLDPKQTIILQHRGVANFKSAKIVESIADFDKYIAANPRVEPEHWQRGISHYYAGEFVKGRKQFEIHQTVNPNDVENAVWHFLCVARAESLEKARAAYIPIKGDTRVPMMEVHAMFIGKLKPEDVLASAKAGDAKGQQLERNLFYAHLYLGLYYEITGDAEKSVKYIRLAAAKTEEHGYMGDVARVHALLRKIKPE